MKENILLAMETDYQVNAKILCSSSSGLVTKKIDTRKRMKQNHV